MILNVTINKEGAGFIMIELKDYLLKTSDKLNLRDDPTKWFIKNFDKIVVKTEPEFGKGEITLFDWLVVLKIVWIVTTKLAIQNEDYPLALAIVENLLSSIWWRIK